MNAVFIQALAIVLGAEVETPPAEKGGRSPEVAWVSLTEGVERLRKEYRPLLLNHSLDLEALLEDAATRKLLRAYLCVEVKNSDLRSLYPLPGSSAPPAGPPAAAAEGAPPGPTVAEKLGLVAGAPSLLVVDFRERVARRYRAPLPKREALQRELSRFARESAALARAARRVEKVLEEAEYSYALGETRQAVLQLLPLDDPLSRRELDQPLSERVAAVIARLRREAEARLGDGQALESERRYLEAIEVYRKVARGYPFPEVVRAAQRRQGEAWRKEQGGL